MKIGSADKKLNLANFEGIVNCFLLIVTDCPLWKYFNEYFTTYALGPSEAVKQVLVKMIPPMPLSVQSKPQHNLNLT